MTEEYSTPSIVTLEGEVIQLIEMDTRDSVRITLKDGGYYLVSPKLRDIHDAEGDMVIESFPEGIKSIK